MDKNWFGERLHRGYHMVAPKIAIPLLKTRLKGYVNWSFTNATNMLMGKKFDIPIILNSVNTTTDYEGATEDGTTRLIMWDMELERKCICPQVCQTMAKQELVLKLKLEWL